MTATIHTGAAVRDARAGRNPLKIRNIHHGEFCAGNAKQSRDYRNCWQGLKKNFDGGRRVHQARAEGGSRRTPRSALPPRFLAYARDHKGGWQK